MSSLAGALNIGQIQARDSHVTPNEAMLVAQKHLYWASEHIPNFEDWKNARLSQPVAYYFPNGTKSAYEFTVLVNGKPDGFILVAAQRYMPPILEFGKGEAPSKRLERIGATRIKGFSRGQHRLLYYGGLSYGIELKDGKALDIHGRVVSFSKRITLFSKPYTRSLETSSIYPMSTYAEKHIPNVPAWTTTDPGGYSNSYPYNVGPSGDPWSWWDGCTPIAASMVIAYYEPQLQDSWDREALIDVLHHTLKTNATGATWSYNVVPGIENLHEEYQRISKIITLNNIVENDYTAWWESRATGFYDAISDINNDHPLLLWMIDGGSALDRSQNYGNHTVTVVGYVGYSSAFYWEIHDTWDSGDHYIADGNWKEAWFIFVHRR
ncbi:C39 family peptidase [Thermococcus sp.]